MDSRSPPNPADPDAPESATEKTFYAGASLAAAFGVWLRNIVPVSVIVLVVNIPTFVLDYLIWHRAIRFPNPTIERYAMAIFGQFLASIASGAVAFGVIQTLRGRQTGVVESISVGVRRLVPVLGTGLLTGASIALGLGILIPGLIFMCGFAVAVPAAVVERVGGTSALRRSWRLTKGSKRSIFGAYFALGVFNYLLDLVIRHVIGFATFARIAEGNALHLIVIGGVSAVFGPVLYHDLRTAKEGATIEEIAAVFD